MKISETILSQFRPEILPLLYFSIFQTWLIFNFPTFIRLGAPLSTIVSISLSILGILIYISIIIFPEKYVPSYNANFLDSAPNAPIFKRAYNIVRISISISIMLYVWYSDYYRMPNIDYVILYAHYGIVYAFIVRAMERYNKRP